MANDSVTSVGRRRTFTFIATLLLILMTTATSKAAVAPTILAGFRHFHSVCC